MTAATTTATNTAAPALMAQPTIAAGKRPPKSGWGDIGKGLAFLSPWVVGFTVFTIINLALAVGLQGRVPEAESIVSAGLPPEEAAESVSALKRMLPEGSQPAARRSRSAERSAASRS